MFPTDMLFEVFVLCEELFGRFLEEKPGIKKTLHTSNFTPARLFTLVTQPLSCCQCSVSQVPQFAPEPRRHGGRGKHG